MAIPCRCFHKQNTNCVGCSSSLNLRSTCCKEFQKHFCFYALVNLDLMLQGDSPNPFLLLYLSKHFCHSNLPLVSMWLCGDSDQQASFFCGVVPCLISRLVQFVLWCCLFYSHKWAEGVGKQNQGINCYFDGRLQIDYKEKQCVYFNV